MPCGRLACSIGTSFSGRGSTFAFSALFIDAYEPGTTSAQIEQLFAPLRNELVPLIAAIAESGREPRREIVTRP